MNKKFSVIFILLAFMLTVTYALNNKRVNAMAGENKSLNIESRSAYLIDADSKTVIFAQNETEHRPIASMCKIMTLLLTFEEIDSGAFDLESDIYVSDNASGMGGSQVFLEANTEYKAKDLIKSIVVASANDASVAMAEKICGSEEEFVNKMNQKAKSLNMNDTVFVNCTGLPKAGQFSCAKDVAVMFCELIKHRDYFKFSNVWMDEISHPKDRKTEISNTNKLIRFYDGCDCGKTGYTSEAGHCLCASAKRNGLRLVSVVLKAPDSKTRFKDISSMFNYGFANYANKLILDDKPLDLTISVESGKKNSISVVPDRKLFLFSKMNEQRGVEINFEPCEKIVAPVNKGDVVGKISVIENGVEIMSANIISLEDVEEAAYFDYIKNIITEWPLI